MWGARGAGNKGETAGLELIAQPRTGRPPQTTVTSPRLLSPTYTPPHTHTCGMSTPSLLKVHSDTTWEGGMKGAEFAGAQRLGKGSIWGLVWLVQPEQRAAWKAQTFLGQQPTAMQ